ncbi:hypothetical protein [Actinokineospora sp. HUAS TT18]|uniref:hypothetical protein n=1 Tax=Actinokineospora sp. HUAS TT18 TaxID=3447451 RepID=UPI003F52432C
MDIASARVIADGLLAGMDSDEPLALVPAATDIGWAWVFRWVVADDPDAVPAPGGGPIVVVKALGRAWMLLPSRSYDDQLAEFAAHYGYEHTVSLG